jgi:dimethylsulfone monooxygenase
VSLRPNALHNANRLKLGLFSLNADGGIAITKVPERWQAGWAEIAEVAKMVDRAGFEFILPIARWKGFGGELDVRTRCFETFTFASALSATTEQITIFSTVHVPVVHPVFAAKALVTVDHVSGGRAGLNIVAGWNQGEFDMFGHALAENDRRYEQGLEWFDVMSKIFTSKERFDHDGEFYKLNRQLDTNEIFNERKRYAAA